MVVAFPLPDVVSGLIPTPASYPPPRLIPGIVDESGQPLLMPYDEAGWRQWYAEVLAHRVRMARACRGEDTDGSSTTSARQAQAANRALCAQPGANGTLYWLATFGWVLESRNDDGQQRLPFIPWPRQVELLDELDDVYRYALPDPRAVLMEIKSRDVGCSWIDAADTDKQWLFAEFFNAAVISADLDLAANYKLTKSYFFKLFYLIKNSPQFLWPEGFAGFGDRSPHAQKGFLLNPATGSTVIGVSNTPDTERGDKIRKITLEECGTYDAFDDIYNNVVILARNVVGISSVHTKHGYGFYNLIHGREGYRQPARRFEFWWHQVPGRDAAWFTAMKSVMREEDFQREVLMMWLAGTGEFLYPTAQTLRIGDFPFRPGWPTFWSLDDGWDGDFAVSVWQKDVTRHRWRCIAAYYNRAQPIEYWGQFITGRPTGKYVWDEEAREFIAWNREFSIFNAVFYGDRHGENTDLSSGKSPFQVLAEDFGIFVLTMKDPAKNDLKYRRDAVLEQLTSFDFDAHHGAPMVLEALQFSRYPNRRSASQQTNETANAPHIRQPSHLRTTVEYLIINERDEWSGVPAGRGPLPRSSAGAFQPQQLGRRFRPTPTGLAIPYAPEATSSRGWREDSPWSRRS